MSNSTMAAFLFIGIILFIILLFRHSKKQIQKLIGFLQKEEFISLAQAPKEIEKHLSFLSTFSSWKKNVNPPQTFFLFLGRKPGNSIFVNGALIQTQDQYVGISIFLKDPVEPHLQEPWKLNIKEGKNRLKQIDQIHFISTNQVLLIFYCRHTAQKVKLCLNQVDALIDRN